MPKKNQIRKTISVGLVVNTFLKPHRELMLGWMQYGRAHPDVEVRFFFASAATSMANLLAFIDSGIDAIVLCGLSNQMLSDFVAACDRDLPTVILSNIKPSCLDLDSMPKTGLVLIDNDSIGRSVGEFFLGHGLLNFGFIAMNFGDGQRCGHCRCTAFRDVAMSPGDGGRTFSEKTFGVCRPNGDSWDAPIGEIVDWVESLRLPCGVFANGDRSAAVLIDACRHAGIDVPGQIEVVSVNNDYGICDSMGETISSIQLSFDDCIRQTMEMAIGMAESAQGLPTGKRIASVSAYSRVERSSSLSGRNYGKVATRAKEYIRKNACDGISVADVAKEVGVSRRTLETHVKYATGDGVAGLIRRERLKAACKLLAATDIPVTEVIMRSGFNLTSNAGVLFKKAYGMTMREYRTRNQKKFLAQ